ncbi:MAG: hypothetical protein A2X78_01005 [Gammaproteobacteria bacterium GWE2_37_16]|nr:MAG: hypothetical protein A2X78_01005 [Gammaproteobacteria bacterium GWE2_37_16]
MRKINIAITGMILATILTGCANKQPDEFSRISAFRSGAGDNINGIRRTVLQETAGGLGAQAGLAWRSRQLNQIIKDNSRTLDQIFNFNAMLLDNNVLPPVLVEGRNTLNLANNETIRLSDHDYQIIFSARFVTASPSWRDYLWLNYKKPEPPNTSLLPKNKQELKVWNTYLALGWNNGVQQASEIFAANLGRLKRDFGGMVLYRKLYAQNIVSAPFVSQADLGVTGDRNAIRINDRVLRITAISELDPNSKHWKPVLTEEQYVTPSEQDVNKVESDLRLKHLLEKLK